MEQSRGSQNRSTQKDRIGPNNQFVSEAGIQLETELSKVAEWQGVLAALSTPLPSPLLLPLLPGFEKEVGEWSGKESVEQGEWCA